MYVLQSVPCSSAVLQRQCQLSDVALVIQGGFCPWCCRDEKVKVLRSVPPIDLQDTVLGQYTAGNGMEGYLDDEGVPKDSTTPTYAMCVLHIKNERWDGVPFILKAGKVIPASLNSG